MNATNKLIEFYSGRISDPVSRLRFQLCCLMEEQASPAAWRGPLRRRTRTLEILAESGALPLAQLRKQDRALLRLSQAAEAARTVALHGRVLKLGSALALVVVLLGVLGIGVGRQDLAAGEEASGAQDKPEARLVDVWLVESQGGTELYSNGLTISNKFLTHTGPRSYPIFEADNPRWESARWRSAPAGLVFHTTESDLADFSPENNGEILLGGRYLLQFVRREQLYNFVVDRLGRVHRIVPESEYAYHSGNSIWDDEQGLYLGLNQSFIGVAFETLKNGDTPVEKGVTPAQLHGARLLTEWLRKEFAITARNSVVHEMVSVNPGNMLIGYHTDWAGRFPFEAVGLPDNYRETLPSIALLGFGYDDAFVQAIGGRVWPGIHGAEEVFRRRAEQRGAIKSYRARLRKQYGGLLERLRTETPAKSWAEASE
jgi:hypothetical protein